MQNLPGCGYDCKGPNGGTSFGRSIKECEQCQGGCSTGTEQDRPESWSGRWVLFHVPLRKDGAWTECRPVSSCAQGLPPPQPSRRVCCSGVDTVSGLAYCDRLPESDCKPLATNLGLLLFILVNLVPALVKVTF